MPVRQLLRTSVALLGLASAVLAAEPAPSAALAASDPAPIANPAIDWPAYLRLSREAGELRERQRVSEEEFIRLSHEPGTLVLDARSRDKYAQMHVKGAVNLPFTDITVASLQALVPDRATRILIYCNNNFTHAEAAFPTKAPPASLNISTFVTLYTYGYRNVYELGPLLDVRTARLEFEGTDARPEAPAGG